MFHLSPLQYLWLYMFLGISVLSATSLGAKKFDVETGKVLFNITGTGQLTDDVNITVKGEGKLRFRNWGTEALVEEDYVEITSGVLKNIHKVKSCEKFEDTQRFEVNFKTEKILERPMPKGNFKTYYLKGLEKSGQETIAGYTCDVWEAEGVRKCIYKGIPLLVEYYLLGVYYQKKAIDVQLNIETSPSKCMLPNFPVEKFALFKTNIKTKSMKPPRELSKIILSVSQDLHKQLKLNHLSVDSLNAHQKRRVLDKLGENIFEQEKVLLPKLLKAMKEARACLQQVETADKANGCIADVLVLKNKISQNTDNDIGSWDEETKEKIVNDFDEHIPYLESRMKCIRASKSLSDLSTCMKIVS